MSTDLGISLSGDGRSEATAGTPMFEVSLLVAAVTVDDETASLLEAELGKEMSKSEVWLIFVRPGRGSKAGIKAENFRLMTCSSSHVLRLDEEFRDCNSRPVKSKIIRQKVRKSESKRSKIRIQLSLLIPGTPNSRIS